MNIWSEGQKERANEEKFKKAISIKFRLFCKSLLELFDFENWMNKNELNELIKI